MEVRASSPHAFAQSAFLRWLRMAIGTGLCAVALACGAPEPTREPVRAELARLQKQTGLSLVYFDTSIDTIVFEDRSLSPGKKLSLPGSPTGGTISPNGEEVAFSYWNPESRTKLGIMRQDGSGLREFQNIHAGYGFCWSHDKSTLALVVQNPGRMVVLNLDSEKTQDVPMTTFVGSQCWSQDDNRIVYEFLGSIRVYDVRRNKWKALAKGREPSWSPDGNWIAFLDDDTYYAIRPSGEDRKVLFKPKRAVSGLCWSPDSKIVAYVSRTRFPERPWLVVDVGFVRLRIRRLEDNSEDWVAGFSEIHVPTFQWVRMGHLNK